MSKEVEELLMRLLNGLVALVATVGIALGGFALKSTYDAQLGIKELSVRVTGLEQHIRENSDRINENRLKIHTLELDTHSIKTDIKTIKEDVTEIKELLKEQKGNY